MKDQKSLFGNSLVDPPPTEGIKYAGSKLKLLPNILELARRTGAKTVLDGFSGTTRVSQAFAKRGYRVISNRFIAVETNERLIENTQARWIILSYSSGGRATADELNEVLQQNGNIVEVVELDYKRNVMAEMKWTNDWVRDAEGPNREFLFLLEKNGTLADGVHHDEWDTTLR